MGKKLVTYLIEDKSNSARTIEIGTWNGKAIYSSRVKAHTILNREELKRPGIYFLKLNNENVDSILEKIYIGESENISRRLEEHLTEEKKDFSEFICFINKDDFLTKAHIKYLESISIEMAKKAKNSILDNINDSSKPTLHEAEISDMNFFFEQIKFILPTVGFRFLTNITKEHNQEVKEQRKKEEYFITINRKKLATMIIEDEGYIVLKGSKCKNHTTKSISTGRVKMKKDLLDSKVLIEENKDYLIFTEDTIFQSPSFAASIVLGKQAAGPKEWKNKDNIALKDIETKNPDS